MTAVNVTQHTPAQGVINIMKGMKKARELLLLLFYCINFAIEDYTQGERESTNLQI